MLRAVAAHAWKNVHHPVHMTLTQVKVRVSGKEGGPKDSLAHTNVPSRSPASRGICVEVLLLKREFVELFVGCGFRNVSGNQCGFFYRLTVTFLL